LAGRVGLTETRSARDCAAAPDTLEAPKPGFTRRFSSAVSPTRRSPRRRRFGISASSPTSTGLTDGSIHGEHSQYRSAGRAGGRIMYAPPPAPEAIPRPTAPSRRIVCQRRLQLCVSGVLAGFRLRRARGHGPSRLTQRDQTTAHVFQQAFRRRADPVGWTQSARS
jgi:hypothetical protein